MPKPTKRVDRSVDLTATAYKRPWMTSFLAEFARGGNINAAAKASGISRAVVYRARETDTVFEAGWADALQEAADRIREEVHRRAIDGWLEPVVGKIGDYRDGHLLGRDGKPMYIRKFDNGLLARLAAAHCPEFREKGADQPTINVTIQITPEKLSQIQERRRVQWDRLILGKN